MNPRDKLFYEGLSKGAIGIFDKNPTTIGIIMGLPSFLVGVGAIGIRIIMRKRQGILEFLDMVKLVFHIMLILLLYYPTILFGDKELWSLPNNYPLIYLAIVLLATIYHFFIDFRYPRVGLENKKEYRGKNILSKPELDESRDIKVRLIDPAIVAIIALSLLLTESTKLIGIILLINAVCLLFEELEYNYHITSLRRNWIGNEEFAKFITQLKENDASKKAEDDDFFNPRLTN